MPSLLSSPGMVKSVAGCGGFMAFTPHLQTLHPTSPDPMLQPCCLALQACVWRLQVAVLQMPHCGDCLLLL